MSDFTTIPTLDLSLLKDPGAREALRLHMLHIVRNVGMCYVTGLPFSPETFAKAKAECEAFFNLPEEEKKKLDIANVPGFLGYTAVRISAVSSRHI
jgi:isopenicillin N synthase-like dioxygenase